MESVCRIGGNAMEGFLCYLGIAAIIFVFFGVKTGDWGRALLYALLWPLWVGYLIISLFWGIGSKL